jgi:hypothetical protein
MKNRDINRGHLAKAFCSFFFLAFLIVGNQELLAQGYDTGGTLDDPDRRVILNNASDRIKTITQIVYIVNDVTAPNGVRFIYQDSPEMANPGAGGSATPFMTNNSITDSDAVRIYRIRVDTTALNDGAGVGVADIYPIDRIPVSASNFGDDMVSGSTPSNQATIVRTGNSTQLPYDFNATGTTPVQDYIDELINVVSIADMRSYWDLDTGSLGAAGEDFNNTGGNVAPERFVDIMYDQLFCCFDFIAVSERWGNTPMALAALDAQGNILRRNSPNPNDPNYTPLTGSDKSFRVDFAGAGQGGLYQWNTGIQNGFGDDSGNQPQWISMFQIRQFYGGGLDNLPEGESTTDHQGPGGAGSIVDLTSESPIPVFGYRIYMLSDDGNGGDGKILSLESPRITFTEDECFRTLSSPFEGMTYAQLLEQFWTQGAANADFDGGDANVFRFDINATSSEPGFAAGTGDYEPIADLDTVIPQGEGFLMSIFTDDIFGVPGAWDKALNRLRGKENGDGPSDVVTPSVNPTPDGFTLLGNPYASPIDFDLLTKSDLTDVAYIYDNPNANWVSSSPITGLGDFDGIISPFQGFFVQTLTSPAGTPSVEFNDGAKVPDATATFYGKEDSSSEVNFVRLELEGQDLNTSAWIAFAEEGSTDGYTYGDALQFEPYAGDYAVLATQKMDDTLLDIGVFPHPSQNPGEIEIPLYVETTKTGEFTLRVTDLNLPLSMEGLVLYDRERDVEIPLSEEMEYRFQLNRAKMSKLPDIDSNSCRLAGSDLAMSGTPHKAKVSDTGTTRFIIKLADQRGPDGELPVFVRLNQNYPNPFNPVTQISYELPQQSDVLLEVYDMTGRQIATLVNETVAAGSHQVSFDASDLSSGVYLYRLTAGNQVFSRKLTVIK